MQYLVIIIVILGFFHTIRIYLAGRKARKLHAPADYMETSAKNNDPWRWRIPDDSINLTLEDEKDESKLKFAPCFNQSDYIATIFGILSYAAALVFFLFSLWLYFTADASESYRITMGYFLTGIALFIGIMCFALRQRIISLSMTPKGLLLTYNYGTFFKRKIFYPENSTVLVKFKEQGVSDYDVEQKVPFFEMTIRKVKFCSLTSSKFYIAANQTQISWIIGGISDRFKKDE